jgi:hypothetical protein
MVHFPRIMAQTAQRDQSRSLVVLCAYWRGTRAPIRISRISRSASLGLLCLSLFTITTVPSACSALPKASAAGVNSCSLVGSKRISTPGAAAIGIPAGGLPTPGCPFAIGTYTQPELSNVTYKDSQKAIPSSAPCETAVRYRWPANRLTTPVMARWRSGPNVLGVLSFSSANWASTARATACAASLRNSSPCIVRVAIFSVEVWRSASQYLSLTPLIHTIRTVDTTPTTRLPIKQIFAQSAIWFAVDNDGHIRLPLWFPIEAIIAFIIVGIIRVSPILGRCAL